MSEWSPEFLRGVLDTAPEGIVLCEAKRGDSPVVYVNTAFARLTGYSVDELLGQDLRRLQAWDREQPGRAQLRQAIARGGSARVVMRNYRKDGSGFWNEVLIQPLRSADGALTHFAGFHREVGERDAPGPQPRERLPSWLREDRLSGLCSRAYFEELLRRDWQIALREARLLTLLFFDIDELGRYNDTFGRAAGDACIRRVAGVIGACFRRGSDLLARWEGGCICALLRNPEPVDMPAFASAVAQKVLAQRIRHPRAVKQKFIAISIGVASLSPTPDRSADVLVAAALRALQRAKRREGDSQVAVAGPDELV